MSVLSSRGETAPASSLLPVLLFCGLTACADADSAPVRVPDLTAVEVGAGTATLQWTQVSDGTGRPAKYALVVSDSVPEWPGALSAAAAVEGNEVGAAVQVTVDELVRPKTYYAQLVSFRGNLDSAVVIGKPSNLVSFATAAEPIAPVEDLSVVSVTPTSISLRWTQVDDGTGAPANYVLGFSSPAIDWSEARANAAFVAGTSNSASRSHTVSGLTAGTSYQLQLASIRGSLSDTTTLSTLSNIVSVNTADATSVQPFFSDGFDSGARANANGFTWGSAGSRVSVSSANSLSGDYSLAFRFGPDTLGQDSNAEQRFNLGRNLAELWIEYYLYIPSNFDHRRDAPDNNKFLMLWANQYSTAGDLLVGTEFELPTNGDSRSKMISMSEGYPASSIRRDGYHNLTFLRKAFAGSWVRVRAHFRASSGSGQLDGIWEGWIDDVLGWRSINWSFWYPNGNNFLRNGYLLGWANSGWTLETTFFIDDLRIYESDPGWIMP